MHVTQEELTVRLPALKRIHFIGITSPFCSFSASYLLSKGVTVTASEASQDSEAAKKWIARKVLYEGPHNAEFITSEVELVIFPNGVIPGNPEVEKVLGEDLPYVLVQELLGVISKEYKTIAIAGTHGKTTTTALITWLLHKTIGTPNFIVGDAKDRIAELNSNWESHPESEYLVLEACEYKKQFLARAPEPYISVITHIDLDHTDFYPTQESYNDAFVEFLQHTKDTVIIDDQKLNEKNVLDQLHKRENFSAKIVRTSELREKFGTIESSKLFGAHNQENLLRAACVGTTLGLTESEIQDALKTFLGISSRFEYKGTTTNGALVYKDFAHNPQKILSCLKGAKEAYPNHKLVAIYQPHNFERTFTFQKEIIDSLELADVLIVPNIYSIRESDKEKMLISASDFAQNIKKHFPGKEVCFTDESGTYPKTTAQVKVFDKKETVLLIMSAGDIDKIIPDLLA